MRPIWRITKAVLSTLAHCIYLIVTVRRQPPGEQAYYRALRQREGCRAICRALRVEVEVHGAIPEHVGMLAVSNHLGLLDTVTIASQLPVSFVSKAEVRDWPFIGWVTRLVGVIFVERERRMQTGQLVDRVQARLAEGVPVMVFPEGTTSNGEQVLPFKTGAFAAVADVAAAAVLPLYLQGVAVDDHRDGRTVRKVLTWTPETTMFEHARQLLQARRIVIALHVGAPIPTKGRDRKVLARVSQEAVETLGNGGVGIGNR